MNNIIHWKELNGNKFLVRPNEAMLLEHGYLRRQTIILDRRNKESIQGGVTYDREYVEEYLYHIFKNMNLSLGDAVILLTNGYFNKLEQSHDD